MGQEVGKGRGRNLRNFLFSTFPQPFFQHVDKAVERILEHEHQECRKPCKQAIPRERCEAVRLEIAHQKLYGSPRGKTRTDSSGERGTAYTVAVGAEQVGKFQ